MNNNIYTSGNYLESNPSWHEEDSPWKAGKISNLLNKNNISAQSICEVGCGAGAVLYYLSKLMPSNITFVGYEISQQAHQKSQKYSAQSNITYYLNDFSKEITCYDVCMLIDVFEHIEDYLGFLKMLQPRGQYKIFHIPLDLSIQNLLRPNSFINARKNLGHLHYFTKEIALDMLCSIGYEVIDYQITSSANDTPTKSLKRKIVKYPRSFLYSINQNIAARILGGCSLLVLAK
jgi:D-arabinose 1-dehydrogenase-like Zn-dependent alcohol dehydrogenase